MAVNSASLRTRLMVVILVPLVVISLLAGYWRFTAAKTTSEALFDRTLTALTLAIARDVIVSGGDALSPAALDLMRDTSGGALFYHVNGPDGTFLTGYGYPPPPPSDARLIEGKPVLFDAGYRSKDVRVARLTEYLTIDGVTGFATVTVWQNKTAREALVLQLAFRSALLMGSLILTVAAVVWFGVNIGLKPLTNLQNAISIRSPDDLSVIRRKVPKEVSGIVRTLNALFQQVSNAIASRDVFISDAAHQLKNPAAGILSMAVAAHDAKTEQDRKERTGELVDAARHASRLTQQLLTFERARGLADPGRFKETDLIDLVRSVCARNVTRFVERDVDLEFADETGAAAVLVKLDETLMSETVQNLLDNSLDHAGAENRKVMVTVSATNSMQKISVRDFGQGLAPEEITTAFERFGQVHVGHGSGLGLAIVKATAELHGGEVQVEAMRPGIRFTLIFTLPTGPL